MIFLAIPLTIGAYWLATALYRRRAHPLLNPVLTSMVALIALFALFPLDLEGYQRGSTPMTWLLNPAVVALAVPLHKQLPKMRDHLWAMLGALVAGVLASTVVGTALAVLSGGSATLAASLAPKAVTTPVAMAIAEATGVYPPSPLRRSYLRASSAPRSGSRFSSGSATRVTRRSVSPSAPPAMPSVPRGQPR